MKVAKIKNINPKTRRGIMDWGFSISKSMIDDDYNVHDAISIIKTAISGLEIYCKELKDVKSLVQQGTALKP